MQSLALPEQTGIGEVTLAVSDLERSLAFYEGELGFRRHKESTGEVALGSPHRTLLRLRAEPAARPRPRGVSGLYHVAYLLPRRADLASFLARLLERRVALDGASDHGVSEALYLSDPDGHGIEVYADRPRSEWTYGARPGGGRQLLMRTAPIDAEGLLALGAETARFEALPQGTRIGHIHLNVGDIEAAGAFYVSAIGFDRIASLPSAAFLSAGGYHHHVAVNTWEGYGAPPAPEGTVGLRKFTIEIPDKEAAARVRARIGLEPDASDTLARDPAGNPIQVVG